MGIDFNHERWEQVKRNARAWWEGKLGRPLIYMNITGRAPGRAAPRIPALESGAWYDPRVAPAEIIDRLDYDLSCREFLGDAFPCVWPNFGPGVLAVFMGAMPKPAADTVWFHPAREEAIGNLSLELDLDDKLLRRIKDICRSGHERWNGLVQIGMTDLGGNLDVLSTFRPAEKLLMDLVDFPDQVKRLSWEEHAAWWQAFADINTVLKPVNAGYTAWTPIFSETPYYMLQCDFAYMISPAMFDEFVKPELTASCRRLGHAFYHLDGVGQLPHLDSLLAIEELKGVQWIPGAGQPKGEEWPDVYRKIIKAGKRAQFVGDWRKFDSFIDKVGGAESFIIIGGAPLTERREVEAFLKRHGAM